MSAPAVPAHLCPMCAAPCDCQAETFCIHGCDPGRGARLDAGAIETVEAEFVEAEFVEEAAAAAAAGHDYDQDLPGSAADLLRQFDLSSKDEQRQRWLLYVLLDIRHLLCEIHNTQLEQTKERKTP